LLLAAGKFVMQPSQDGCFQLFLCRRASSNAQRMHLLSDASELLGTHFFCALFPMRISLQNAFCSCTCVMFQVLNNRTFRSSEIPNLSWITVSQ
jgi:hypothetical protein